MPAPFGGPRPVSVALLAVLAAVQLRAQAPEPAPVDGDALVELARVQTELGEFQTAQANYLAGIDRLAAQNGEYAPALIEPYAGLAQAYLGNGQAAEAITVLEQARHISQRNFGLLNVEQAGLLDEMSRAYLLVGDTVEAQNLQRERLTLALRRFGEDDPQVIPFRNQLADYYDRSRMRVRAREQQAVLAIQREHFGEADGRLLVPLSELVRIDILLGDRSSARRRLLRVLESTGNATATQTGGALAVLGDWELALGRTEAAAAYYRDAYATLHGEDPAAAAEYFAAPRLINFVPPPSPVDQRGNRAAYAWGWIEARFGVSADGRATGVGIVQASPAGLMDARYVERLAEATYRPRFVDGEAADTATVAYRHAFRYFVAE